MKTRSLIAPACALLGLLVSPAAFATAFVFDIDYNDPAISNSPEAGRASTCSGGSQDCDAARITTIQNGATLNVTAGLSNSNLAYYSYFNRNYYAAANVYWNGGLEHGGLGVAAGQDQAGCAGASDSMQGSCGGWRLDEILFLDFGTEINLLTAQFNGDNTDLPGAGADFDIYIGDGSNNWTRIINDVAPNGADFITIDTIGQFFAIVADDGLDAGYLEALSIQAVPEPSVLALCCIGILGFGFAARKKI